MGRREPRGRCRQLAEPPDQLEVVRRGLREPESGVDDHLRRVGIPAFSAIARLARKTETNILEQVAVLGAVLIVHRDDAGPGMGR